jgi:hypothetical protein
MKLIIHNLTVGGMGETYALSLSETREEELESLYESDLRKEQWVKNQLQDMGIHPLDAMIFTTSEVITRITTK